MQQLHADTTAVVSRLKPLGRLDGARHLQLAISLPLRNQQALTALLAQLSDPASPNYRKYLTPAQFAERFGPSDADYAAVAAFAQAHGLTVTARHPNRLILDVDGAVSDIEKTLHVTMRIYHHPSEARQFYAPDADPTIDLAVPLLRISGLDNFEPPRPRLKVKSPKASLQPAPAAGQVAAPNGGSGPGGGYIGNDFRAAYVPGTALSGSGQAIALLEFDGYAAGDIAYYENLAGLPNVPLTNVLLDGFTGAPTGDGGEVEVSLDIEMAISMAPCASGILVYEAGPAGNWHDILCQMATDNVAKQISCSWYIPAGPADPVADMIFQEMAAQGQSFFSAAGDDDAYTGLIPFPGDTPFITAVGGTTLTTSGSGGPYSSETVWNWNDGNGSGGGISTQYAIPAWQQSVSMAANLGSTTMRNVPDVAMVADNVYVRADGADQNVGGTSCAAPLWAAFTALANQQAVANGNPVAGFINPAIYAIGIGTGYGAAFNDTTAGNNFSASSPMRFSAATGYDLCTGWGSPAGTALINALAGSPVPVVSTASLLPNGAVGAAYSQALTASGGAAPYAWSISAGTLPAGLSLGGNGVISGTPMASGTASFTVQVTGSNGLFSATAFSLAIYAQGTPIIATASPLATGTFGAGYSQTFTASGGAAPYTWAMVSGSLPSGLGLSGEGLLSGTPAATGSFGFTVQVTGSDGLFSTTPFVLTVPPPPAITSALAVTGTDGAAFTYQITAANNPASYYASGLPAGLSVNTATGLVSGTVTTTGTIGITIGAANSGGAASAPLVITILEMPPPVITWPFATLSSFSFGNGAFPTDAPTQGADGNFYGTTTGGGYGDGALFEMNPAGTLTSLGAFDGADGTESFGCLVQGTNGSLYGTTYGGGSDGYGTVFDITTSGSLTSLCSFGYSNGAFPTDGLALGSDGNFYGTTTGGGSSGCGSVFEISPGGSLTTLFSFDFGDGYSPTAGLVQGSDGTFYGTTEEGGSYGEGTVFNITTGGSLTTLVNFNGANGDEPVGELAQGGDGNFYGTTFYGGTANDGTIFMMTTSGSLTTLCSFTGTNGANPIAGLAQGSDGNFYGTTYAGGAGGVGTVFMVTTSGSLTTLYTFNGLNGANPQAGLIQTSAGSFYGTTYAGGAYGYGTVFSLVPFSVTATLGAPFTYQVTAASNAPPTYSATNLPAGLSMNAATGLISGTPTALGTSSVNMSASNAGGAASATLTIAVVSGVPVITSALSATGSSGAAFRYQTAATERPTSYGASGLPAGLSVNTATGVISGSTTVSGTTVATISAINASGTGSANLSIYIVPPAPVVPFSASVTGTVGMPFSYQIIASNNPTSYGATGLLAGLQLSASTGVISGTPISTGTAGVKVSASNAGGTGTGTLYLTIVSGLPAINSASSAAGTTGLPFSYQITATNNPTSFGASGLPSGLSVSAATGLISGTATSSGTTHATVSAVNASGTGSAALTITMTSTAPVITGSLSATGMLGQEFSYRITATNNPTGYGASGLPTGLSVNTSSGFITGTAAATGTSAATISAINASGTGSAILTIKVIQGVPVINSSSTAKGTVGALFFYNITATNNPTSYSASGLPAGLSVSTATGVISGTATTSGTTSSTIRAINASGTGSATLVITIVPPVPVITSTLNATGTSGVLFTYQITAANNPTSYGASSLPAGLGVNTTTGLISGTATSSGSTSAVIRAISASGTGSAILVIDMLPPPPVIASALSATGTLGTLFSYQIVATNGPMSGYSASGLPPGLSVNTATGLISGTAASSGTSSATIGAYSLSGSASASLAITIRVSFAAWQNLWFTSAQLGNSAISSDTAAPEGDGIPNLLKYAFNLSPMANGISALPVESVMTAGGTNYLTLAYTQDIFASDVTYIPEVSVDMQNWSSGALYFAPVSVTPNADGVTETVVVQDLAPVGASPQFLRLMVTGP